MISYVIKLTKAMVAIEKLQCCLNFCLSMFKLLLDRMVREIIETGIIYR